MLLSNWEVSDLPKWVAKRITVHPVSGCWIVGGYHDEKGYARIRGRSAHREIWQMLEGPVDDELVLDHREDWGCLYKACGFPGHMLPVTQVENATRDGAGGVGAENMRKTHCTVCGTPYDAANCYIKPDGHRDCRVCIRRRVAEYKVRVRAGQKVARRPELARAALWPGSRHSRSALMMPAGQGREAARPERAAPLDAAAI